MKRAFFLAALVACATANAETVVWYTFDDLGDVGTKLEKSSTVSNAANPSTYGATVYQMAGMTKNSNQSGTTDFLYVTNGIPETFRVFDPVARALASSADKAVRFASGGGGQAGAMLETATGSSFFAESFTVEALVRFPDGMANAAYGVLATQLCDGSSLAWKLKFTWNRELQVTFRNSSGEDVELGKATVSDKFNDGKWHHVAMTVVQGETSSTVNVYLDYVLNKTYTPAYRVQFPASAENSVLQIGGTTLEGALFMGEIGEFRYSGAALEKEQFLHPRAEGLDDECVLYYDFETSHDWSWLAASVGTVANMASPALMDGSLVTKNFTEKGTLPKIDGEASPASRIRQSLGDFDWADNASSLYNNYESTRNSENYLYSDLSSGLSLAETNFTIEAFYKTDGAVEYWTPLFRDNGTNEPVFLGMGNNVDGIGNSCFCGKVTQDDGSTTITVTDTAKTNDGKWHHIALVRDGRTLKLYRDKVLRASATLTSDSLLASGSRWQFCGSPASNTYNGWLDSVRVTRRALGPEEFLTSQRYSEGHTIAHLKFDDGTANAADGGGALFDGAINNATFNDTVPGYKILDGEGGTVLSKPDVASLSIATTSDTVMWSDWDDQYYLRMDTNGNERTSGTVELWVKASTAKTYGVILDAKFTANGKYDDNLHAWKLGFDASTGKNPSILFRHLKSDGTRDNQRVDFPTNVIDNAWHHWAFTFAPNASNPAKSDVAFYLDYVQVPGTAQTLNGRVAYDDTLRFAVGEGNASVPGTMIDELRISDCVLTPAQFLHSEKQLGLTIIFR